MYFLIFSCEESSNAGKSKPRGLSLAAEGLLTCRQRAIVPLLLHDSLRRIRTFLVEFRQRVHTVCLGFREGVRSSTNCFNYSFRIPVSFEKSEEFYLCPFNASYSNHKIGSEWLTIRAYDWDSSRVSVRSIAVP